MTNLRIVITLIIFLIITKLNAFNVVIAGKAPAGYKLKLHCAALIEDIRLDQNAKGEFLYVTELKYPTQFQLEYGNARGAAYDFFVFEEGKIEIDILNETESGIKVKGLSPRSAAFANIEPLLFEKYAPKLKKSNAIDSLLNAVVDAIKAIPNIGNDEYVEVLSKVGRLVLMSTMLTSNYTPMFNVYYSPYYSEIPKQDVRYAGFDLYNNLIWPGWVEKIKKNISNTKGVPDYKPGFREVYDQLEMHKSTVLPKTYVNAKYITLVSADKNKMTDNEKSDWEKALLAFCNTYPDYPFTVFLRQSFEDYSNSMVNKPAPSFELRDLNNKPVELKEFKGKYVLLDVWGSWCVPCRIYNKELVQLYEEYKSKGLEFISVDYDKLEEDWKKAVLEDKLSWTQLYYNQAFLDSYKILGYPTSFLISPDQVILKRSNHISKEDLEEFIK